MSETVSFKEFQKLDIRIGKIQRAEHVPDTEKLLKLVFDFGGFKRQIIAGILHAVEDPRDLVGMEMPVIVNLTPRTLRGLESQGMILATDENGTPVFLHPAREVLPGSPVR